MVRNDCRFGFIFVLSAYPSRAADPRPQQAEPGRGRPHSLASCSIGWLRRWRARAVAAPRRAVSGRRRRAPPRALNLA